MLRYLEWIPEKQSLGKGTRSDTIMIASLNQETGEVKLSSVYRDTLLAAVRRNL